MLKNWKLIAMLLLTFMMGVALTLCILKIIPEIYWFVAILLGILNGYLIGNFWKEYWE